MGCSDKRRFELELEFLHCLANPGYLNCECGRGWQGREVQRTCGMARRHLGMAFFWRCRWMQQAGLAVFTRHSIQLPCGTADWRRQC